MNSVIVLKLATENTNCYKSQYKRTK